MSIHFHKESRCEDMLLACVKQNAGKELKVVQCLEIPL